MKLRIGLFIAAGLAVLGIVWGVARSRVARLPAWKPVAPGVEMCTFRIVAGEIPGLESVVNVAAVRAPASRIRIAAGSSLDAGGWRRNIGALAAVNGGFFDTTGQTLGLVVSDGQVKGRLRHVSGGVFYILGGAAHILPTHDFSRAYPSLRGIQQAVQCAPLLAVDGRPPRLKPQWARRSGIGIQRSGKVVFAVADGPLPLPTWAEHWAAKDGLDCVQALNLDGGPSSQLSVKTPQFSREISGGWPVPDAVVVR